MANGSNRPLVHSRQHGPSDTSPGCGATPGEGKEYVGPLSCPDLEFAEIVETQRITSCPCAAKGGCEGVCRRHPPAWPARLP